MTDVSLRALTAGQLAERRAAEEIRRRYTEQPPSIWTLVYDGFDPARQELREALCALGNGYLVARDALPEAVAASTTWGLTLRAYNRLVSDVAGRDVENEDLINVPNWLPLQFRISGSEWFDVQQADVEEHRLELDKRPVHFDSPAIT